MPVTTKHAEYELREKAWEKCRDAIAGEEAVKERDDVITLRGAVTGYGNLRSDKTSDIPKRTYLPQLNHSDAEYDRYKTRARWYGATGRTLDGLVGAAFRRKPAPDVPDSLLDLLDNIDLAGATFGEMAKTAVREVLAVGRYAVVLDYSDAERRPYWCGFKCEQLVNWRYEMRGGRPVLTLAVFLSDAEERGDDEFETTVRQYYRVLKLDESGGYVVETWRVNDKGDPELTGRAAPSIRGQRLGYLPVVMFAATELSACPPRPPLEPLADANIHHYRLSADLMHGLHFTALPWPVVIGGDPDQGSYQIGSEYGTSLPAGATAMYVEFSGAGMSSIRDAMGDLRDEMATLGARMLRSQKREAETAEAMRLAQSGEDATLADVVDTTERGFTQLLAWTAEWMGESGDDVRAGLNRDFVDNAMGAAEALQWAQIVQAGQLTLDDLYDLYKRGEVLAQDVELDEWKARLELEAGKFDFGDVPAERTAPADEDEETEAEGAEGTSGGGEEADAE